ncbi:ROK family protein [Caulobacter sp. 17J65-9]|uniref:ROK family protein n=1 Tax=Caulobacter sp. 17J65-9 TaxID=2709382 RepID=UPI0013CD55DA|nr:ROK family protein [Caulobacter sp. 17J65-9]NEX93441.1 ROK family protein [Caulobacter sp. 17J65-9]
MTHAPLYGCVEAGGTKFVVAAARGPDALIEPARIATTTPAETLAAAVAHLRGIAERHGPFAAIGVASFGPVDPDPQSPRWGRIVETPKPGWSDTDLAGEIGRAFGCPVGFDTDVNGAVLAEAAWGAAQGVDVASYVTVGTGLGAGVLIGGRLVHGTRHPEMGHFRPVRHPADLDYPGSCPWHGGCLEGLACGVAIKARWGASLGGLPPDHVGHEVIASYLAQLVITQQAVLAVRRVILGGGVMDTPGLLERVRRQAAVLAGGYFGPAASDYEALVVRPGLGDRSGVLGALRLAQAAGR